MVIYGKILCHLVFCNTFKKRLNDNFTQTWRVDIENNQKLSLCKHFKRNFEYEQYLNTIQKCIGAAKAVVTYFTYRDWTVETT